jgi:hypothetical protein
MTTTDEGVVIALNALAARKLRIGPDPNKQYPYILVPFDEIKMGTGSPYLVNKVLPLYGLGAVWGPPKCGKSFWAFDLSMHIALGWRYRGLRVQQGPVAYLAFEGGDGFRARVEAYRRKHTLPAGVPFHLLVSNAKLVRDHGKLIECIDEHMSNPPVCVVLDTLNRSIDGSESKDVDMAAYLTAADAINDAFACMVLVVHHCGIDASRPRGHTSLTGAVDVQLSCKRDAENKIVVEVEAMKDGAEGTTFTSRLEVVEVGTDDEGQPLTSCVIVPAEATVAAPKGPKLRSGNKLAWDTLIELVVECGETAPPSNHIPPKAKVIPIPLWRETFCAKYPDDKQAKSKGKAFIRAFLALQEKRLIGVWQDKAWPAEPRSAGRASGGSGGGTDEYQF